MLVFIDSQRGHRDEDPDELAFNVDAAGFDDVLQRARRLEALKRGGSMADADADGRRLEFTFDDHTVYWT